MPPVPTWVIHIVAERGHQEGEVLQPGQLVRLPGVHEDGVGDNKYGHRVIEIVVGVAVVHGLHFAQETVQELCSQTEASAHCSASLMHQPPHSF